MRLLRPASFRLVRGSPTETGRAGHDPGPDLGLESDPDKTSEVEVTFIALAGDRTRVDIEHRHLDRHGEGWAGVRDGVSTGEGWSHYLNRYAALLTR